MALPLIDLARVDVPGTVANSMSKCRHLVLLVLKEPVWKSSLDSTLTAGDTTIEVRRCGRCSCMPFTRPRAARGCRGGPPLSPACTRVAPQLRLNRMRAQKRAETGEVDVRGRFSVFSQAMRQLNVLHPSALRRHGKVSTQQGPVPRVRCVWYVRSRVMGF